MTIQTPPTPRLTSEQSQALAAAAAAVNRLAILRLYSAPTLTDGRLDTRC